MEGSSRPDRELLDAAVLCRHLAAVAVVILSGDDEGRTRAANDSQLALRARQDVVYEMGWFRGRLGRHAVVALIEEGVETPSDTSMSGVVSIPFDTEAAGATGWLKSSAPAASRSTSTTSPDPAAWVAVVVAKSR
jgi:predicted nucleotide-binding protein